MTTRSTIRGGWPFRHPPNIQFTLNTASPQAAGLVTWWPTIGSWGKAALKDFARGLDADNVGGSPAWVADGLVGAALDFTRADNDALSTTNTLGFDYDNMTYSLWVYPTQGAGNRMTMLSPNNIAAAVALETDDTTGNNGRLSLVRPGLFVARTNQGVMSINNWYHVVYTKWGVNAGEQAIYINGLSVALAVDVGDNLGSAATIWRIGERAAASQSFEGRLADIRIYNRSLVAVEVHALYVNRWELYRSAAPYLYAFAPTTTRIPRHPAQYNTLAIY